MVYLARLGSRPSTILLKYGAQWFMTSALLRREQPDTVFVMTPPVFAALPAFWYAWRRGKRVVLDAHTCAFVLARWRFFQWLQRALCRLAITTLVTNQHLADRLRAAGGHATIVPDVPIIFASREAFPRPSAFTVAVVCSFDEDEPIEAIFAAAERLPDVRFFITGSPDDLLRRTGQPIPPNVMLTGFLAIPAYGGLLAAADAVMDLTTFDHTMLRGAYEAIYQGTPVIVSDWRVLRDAFPIGALHVNNTASAIAEAIREMQRRPGHYRDGARQLREHKLAQWKSTRQAILARMAGTTSEQC
jgi:glycosyltransferase involved in cell wall biosynthesis